MIRLEGERWVVPSPPYLFRRGTEQAFYDIISHAGREFAAFFGYVFEEYVNRILSTLGSDYDIVEEREYKRDSHPYRTCDRIIIRGSDAILIECKTKRLSVKTKFTTDYKRQGELLRIDLTDVGKTRDDKGSVVSAIRQLYRTEMAIRSNCAGLEALHARITGRFYPLVLVLDPYYSANAPYIKGIIAEELRKGDSPVEDYDWQVVDARGLEPLCALAREVEFIDLVDKKFSTYELQVQDMPIFLEGITREENISREVLVHPVIDREIDAFSQEVKERYGTKFLN